MATLRAQDVKEFGLAQGLDMVGIANIERFEGAPPRMHPASIMPHAKSVIVVIRRILRGNWRGIEEGTYWPGYTYFGYHGRLNTHFIPRPLYDTACMLEDHGWEAVPYYPGVPESQPVNATPVRPGAPAPEVHLAIRIAGIAAGLGECGWSKVFLTKKFGPRVRLHAIVTDAELEPDPLVEPGSLCDRCGACIGGCQANAIPRFDEGKVVRVRIEDKTYEWGDVHMGRCTLGFHGGDAQVSPFIHKNFAGREFDVREQDLTEDMAYKICWPFSLDRWMRRGEDASGYVCEGHAKIAEWGQGGSYAVGGSRGCMRSCFDHLEQKRVCDQTFHSGRFIRRKRWLLPAHVSKPATDSDRTC